MTFAVPDKAVVVNHVIWQRGGAGRQATLANAAHSVEYLSRTGDFEERGGCAREVTAADRDLARLREQVGYRGRTGAYEGRSPELPLAEGEVSGGCWGPLGVVDERALPKQVSDAESSYITSVVTVAREHAATLGLTTKSDFQALMRATWTDAVASWGIIERKDIRWAAWFHTDNPRSVHVHVMTWDASGRFSGDARIPHSALVSSNNEIRRAAFGKLSLEAERAKGYLRDLAVLKLKMEMGQEGAALKIPEMEARREAAEIASPPASYGKSVSGDAEERLSRTREALLAVLPESGRGYVQFRSLPREARGEVLAALKEHVGASPGLARIERGYREAVEQLASAKSLRHNERDRYVNAQMFDLRARMANALLKDAASHNVPVERDPELRRETALLAGRAGETARNLSLRNPGWSHDRVFRETMSVPTLKREAEEIAGRSARVMERAAAREGRAAQRDQCIGRSRKAVRARMTSGMERACGIGPIERASERSMGAARRAARYDALRASMLGPEMSREVAREQELIKSHGGARGVAHLDREGRVALERAASCIVDCERIRSMVAKEASLAAAKNHSSFQAEYSRALEEKRQAAREGLLASIAAPYKSAIAIDALALSSATLSGRGRTTTPRARMTEAELIERSRSLARKPRERGFDISR